MYLLQSKYIIDVSAKAGMSNCKPCSTPMTTNNLNSSTTLNATFSDPSLFHSLVGPFEYITTPWPELSFSVNIVCQAMYKPTEDDFSVIKRILRYL